MSTEKDELLKFLQNDSKNRLDFPVILKTQRSITSLKSDPLRRNTSIQNSYYRKHDVRLVSKRGRVKIYFTKIPQKSLRYARDLWNTLVNMQWRWLTLVVASANVLAYFGCGLLFYYDSWFSGDFDNNPDHLICIKGVQSISNFFMLGIETVTTTGYGYLHPTEHCNLYFVVLTFSTLTSILIDGAFISVVYAKLNRTKDKNMYGQIFSRKAVIALRNGKLCLIIRVNDREGKHWINSDVHLYMVKEATTQEGETIANYVTELDTTLFGMLFWPVDVVHEIGPSSPLWNISAHDLMTTKLEILVVLSGSSVKTGQLTRSQASYLNKEIMWGYQFSSCLEYNAAKSEYFVNKRFFNHTISQEVPLCSAKVLHNVENRMKIQRKSLDLSYLNASNGNLENVIKYREM